MNQIRNGQSIPDDCTNGTILYIYKNYGDAIECGNYRPICLTRIVYEIWSGIITTKLTKITHKLTRSNQYGYKEGIPTADAIIIIEKYISHADRAAAISLVGLWKAFGAINMTLLWNTHYEKELPGEMRKRIRRGHRRTKISPKYNGKYGDPGENNIGV